MSYIAILLTFIFINNFILVQFLGLCPFIGVSKNSENAIGMGVSVTFVTTVASVVTWAVYYFLLVPFNLQYLQTLTFILVIASLVQLLEMVIQKVSPALYKALGIYLPLITTNCAVLGIAIINISNNYNVMEAFTAGLAAGLGFTLAIVLMSNIRERLMALAFMAFDKSLITNLHLV